MEVKSRARVLYILPSLVPPPRDPVFDRVTYLPDTLEGVVLQPSWFAGPDEMSAHLGAPCLDGFRRANFTYRFFYALHPTVKRWKWESMLFYVSTALRLHRVNPFDCIVVYGHQATGVIGRILRALLCVPLVVEIMTTPHLIGRGEDRISRRRAWIRRLYSDFLLHLSAGGADHIHLLYPGQLDAYPTLRTKPHSVFHDFVPTTAVGRRNPPTGAPRIVVIGAPWYLKGWDRAISAFKRIADRFPEARLELQGHAPDGTELRALIADHPAISVHAAVPQDKTYERLRDADILLHPSRLEGLPRIVIEAMTAGVPVVASEVGGIPFLIQDGVNGHVVLDGEASELANRLSQLLEDDALRDRLGRSASDRAREYSDGRYGQRFADMIALVHQQQKRR